MVLEAFELLLGGGTMISFRSLARRNEYLTGDSNSKESVEGRDEKFAVINLLHRHGIQWDKPSDDIPFVAPTGSISKMLSPDSISANVKNYRRIGWVLDADFHPADRWGHSGIEDRRSGRHMDYAGQLKSGNAGRFSGQARPSR